MTQEEVQVVELLNHKHNHRFFPAGDAFYIACRSCGTEYYLGYAGATIMNVRRAKEQGWTFNVDAKSILCSSCALSEENHNQTIHFIFNSFTYSDIVPPVAYLSCDHCDRSLILHKDEQYILRIKDAGWIVDAKEQHICCGQCKNTWGNPAVAKETQLTYNLFVESLIGVSLKQLDAARLALAEAREYCHDGKLPEKAEQISMIINQLDDTIIFNLKFTL